MPGGQEGDCGPGGQYGSLPLRYDSGTFFLTAERQGPAMGARKIFFRGGQIRGLGRKSPSRVQGWNSGGGVGSTDRIVY